MTILKQQAPPHRFVDLFSGIGGFRFGFEPKGCTCVWSCEIDHYARRTYSQNHDEPEENIFPDVYDADAHFIPDHDILIAGFSCQPFSKAGVSKANSLNQPHGFANQTHGTLFFEIIRILASHRPKAFLLENVPNLVNHDQGRTFATVNYLLNQELGYHTSHRILDARPFVPQHRKRIFIAGYQEADRPSMHDIHLPPSQSGPVLADILHPQDGNERPEEPYTTGPQATVAEKYTLGDGTWAALQQHRSKHQSAGNGFGYTISATDQPTRTLTARYGKDGQEILIHQPNSNPRRLTPRECSRLMGMDNLIIPVSDTQAYRQLGNSVVPQLVEYIAEQIVA